VFKLAGSLLRQFASGFLAGLDGRVLGLGVMRRRIKKFSAPWRARMRLRSSWKSRPVPSGNHSRSPVLTNLRNVFAVHEVQELVVTFKAEWIPTKSPPEETPFRWNSKVASEKAALRVNRPRKPSSAKLSLEQKRAFEKRKSEPFNGIPKGLGLPWRIHGPGEKRVARNVASRGRPSRSAASRQE